MPFLRKARRKATPSQSLCSLHWKHLGGGREVRLYTFVHAVWENSALNDTQLSRPSTQIPHNVPIALPDPNCRESHSSSPQTCSPWRDISLPTPSRKTWPEQQLTALPKIHSPPASDKLFYTTLSSQEHIIPVLQGWSGHLRRPWQTLPAPGFDQELANRAL